MIIDFENTKIVVQDQSVYSRWAIDPLIPGQSYMAKRNTGWKLLTCLSVTMSGGEPSFVNAQEKAYAFDAWECFKVLEIL